MQFVLSVGGSITGEHGVGMEKMNLMPLMFTPDDLDVMTRLRNAFNPDSILNPQKMLPGAHMCREVTAPLPKAVVEAAPGVPV